MARSHANREETKRLANSSTPICLAIGVALELGMRGAPIGKRLAASRFVAVFVWPSQSSLGDSNLPFPLINRPTTDVLPNP